MDFRFQPIKNQKTFCMLNIIEIKKYQQQQQIQIPIIILWHERGYPLFLLAFGGNYLCFQYLFIRFLTMFGSFLFNPEPGRKQQKQY